MKTAQATTHFSITVERPYCGKYEDRREDLREYLDNSSLGTEGIEAEIKCSRCKEYFIVTDIIY
jgi:hypothetical protein